MQGDRTDRPDDGPQDRSAWDEAPALPPYFDGRLTNADFVDPPRRADHPRDDDAPPLYDGRPIRDPYARGGGYRRAPDHVWARAREDYLAGDAAETVCARHGLALSTFRQRARVGGWRREDQVDPEPVDLAFELEAGLPDYGDIARHALVRMNRAVLAGRAPEAAGWMRIHRQMMDLARAADAAPPPPKPAPAPSPANVDEVIVQMREVESIVREAATVADDDLEAQQRLLARAEALTARPISHYSHHSDGVFPADGPAPAEPVPDPP